MDAKNFLESLVSQDESAGEIFHSMLNDRISDALEVRKVEVASEILDEAVAGSETPEKDKPLLRPTYQVWNTKTGNVHHVTKFEGSAKEAHKDIVDQMKAKGDEGWKHVEIKKNQRHHPAFRTEELELLESDAARELVLHAQNTRSLYDTSERPIMKNLQRKVDKGIYDHEKATKLWGYHANRAAQSYHKAHGGGGGLPWHKMFTPSDRKIAAKQFADQAKGDLHEGAMEDAIANHPRGPEHAKKLASAFKQMKSDTAEQDRIINTQQFPSSKPKIKEDTVNEISVELAKSYLDKTKPGSKGADVIGKTIRDAGKRMYGRAQAQEKLGQKKTDKNESVEIDEVAVGGSNVASQKNILQNIRRATQVLGLKGVNPQMAANAHKDYSKLTARNPKTPGYMLLRKLAPNKAATMQTMSQAGVPLGGNLSANPSDFNQALQRIKRFK